MPHHPEIWGDLCRWYKPIVHRNDTQAWAMLGAGAEVFVRRGQLMLRNLSPLPALYSGFRLHPDDDEDPYVFRIDLSEFEMPTARIVFSGEPAGETTSMHLDLFPWSLETRSASKNPRFWVAGGLTLGATAIAVRGRCAP